MRVVVITPLLLILLVGSAAASRHEVQVQILSTKSQTVGGVGVGIGPGADVAIAPGGDGASTTTCPLTYPDGTGTVQYCVLPGPSGDELGQVQNRRVEAIITTEGGQRYYVVLGCERQYGWCMPLAERATYVGKIDEQPKWLANYQHRPGTGFMKVSLHPDGKKKVTYQIEYAVKVVKR